MSRREPRSTKDTRQPAFVFVWRRRLAPPPVPSRRRPKGNNERFTITVHPDTVKNEWESIRLSDQIKRWEVVQEGQQGDVRIARVNRTGSSSKPGFTFTL